MPDAEMKTAHPIQKILLVGMYDKRSLSLTPLILKCDSNILVKKERAWDILQYIVKKKSNKKLRFEFDPLMLDARTIDVLDSLSQNEFNFGIQ
jgi:hypothetical protein